MRRIWRGSGVALVLFGILPVAAPAFAADLLILATGERRAGVLASCDDESCRFDGKAVPLAGLMWIGLGVGGDGEELPPRGIASPGAVLANGTLTAGRLVGLSLGTIVLDTVELDRGAARWLRIARFRRRSTFWCAGTARCAPARSRAAPREPAQWPVRPRPAPTSPGSPWA